MPKALLIYNPVAGRYPSRLLTERAATVFRRRGWKIDIETTRDSEHVCQLAHQASAADFDALIVVGGDGTINRALPGLVGKRTALGVLPAGTANVWAQELGLPGLSWTRWMALEESAHRLASGYVRRIDVGMCNQSYFLLWAGIGLDAFLVHRIEPRKQWEKHFALVQYAATAVWNAAIWHGMNLEVVSENNHIEGHYMLAVVSNIRLYAGGLARLSPNAKLDDGRMDLWLFEGDSLEDTFRQAWDLWAGKHLESARVSYVPFEEITLSSDVEMSVQIDGEPEHGGENIRIKVVPQILNILVPEKVPPGLFQVDRSPEMYHEE